MGIITELHLNPRGRPVLTCAILLVLLGFGGEASAEKPFWIVPDRPTDPRLRLEGNTWILPYLGLEIRVRRLDRAGRVEFLHHHHPRLADPFAADGPFPEEHYTFRLDLKNGSAEKVVFHPSNVVLITNRNDQEFPLEYSDFYRRLAGKGGTAETQLRQIPDVFYDGSHVLRPGENASKLLAFPPPRKRWKRLQVYVSFLQIGPETHSFQFPFARHPGKGPEPLLPRKDTVRGKTP